MCSLYFLHHSISVIEMKYRPGGGSMLSILGELQDRLLWLVESTRGLGAGGGLEDEVRKVSNNRIWKA